MESIDKKLLEKLSSAIYLVKKSFECTICMDFFDNAVITNCQHAFCRKCIENYIGSKRTQSCPLCKNTINLRSLKQFSSLEPFILKTKILEEKFTAEMNSVQAGKSAPEKISFVLTDNEHEKINSSISDFSAQIVKSRQKKRTISSEESEACSKKAKQNENELTSTSSIITSTRQDTSLTRAATINEQPDKSINFNETIKIPLTSKVTEWLEKNEPGTSKQAEYSIEENLENTKNKNAVKSSISIARIEKQNSDNMTDDLKNKTKIVTNFDGSIEELSTDPTDSNKKEVVINEAEHEAADLSKIDFVEKLKLRFPSKSYFCKELHIKKFNPLKFTNQSMNKTNNSCMRHKSDSNLSMNTNTTPKLLRSNVIQTPKSAGSNFFNRPPHVVDLSPEITVMPKQLNESSKKTVRFLKSKQSLKRTQSDSDLSQKNQSAALTCLNCAKKIRPTASIGTSTDLPKEKCDQSVQCNFDDFVDIFLENFAKIEAFLIKKVYLILESDILDEILTDYLDSLAQTSVQSIPDSPPNQATVILDTLTINNTISEDKKETQTVLSNELVNRRSSSFLNNFSELLNTTSVKKSSRNKRIPALEFTRYEKNENDGSFLQNFEKNRNLTLIEDTCVNQDDQSLVVEDTPVKMDNQLIDEEIRHINETLSKSASRLQAIVNTSARNRTFSNDKNDNTILFEKENEAPSEKIMVIPDTVQIQNDQAQKSLLNNESTINEKQIEETNDENFKEPKFAVEKKTDFCNHSYFLNSLNATSYNQNQILLTNVSENLSQKNIPLAKDILGVSLANESIVEQSTLNLNQSIMPKIGDSKPTQSNGSKKKKSSETQLLTDSACQIIENICKDHYSVQNETICEEPTSRDALSNITNRPKTQIEFVYSLLPSEMKSIIKNYAQTNGIRISNEITDSTTHLIVDADKNLLCGVTNKYLKAISRKIWIVSVAWILNCINKGQFIKPDKFEIRGDKSFGVHNGPTRSRTSVTCLMAHYEFLFIGEFPSTDSVSLDDLTQLINLNGGVVKRKAKEFSVDDAGQFKIVIFDEKFKKISKKIADTLKQNNIDCVNKTWLIDSLACYKLMDFGEYQTYEK